MTWVLRRGGIVQGAVIKEYLQGVSIFTVPRLTVSGLIVPTSEEAPFLFAFNSTLATKSLNPISGTTLLSVKCMIMEDL